MTENTTRTIRIGTRGSPLALAQAYETRERLVAAGWIAAPEQAELVVVKTKGDRILDRALSAIGGKGLFTKEIEDMLLDGRIDLAVHSMKDMPTVLPDGLVMGTMLPREDVRDAWLSSDGKTLQELPVGAVVGTSSLRRRAQVLAARPDLQVVEFRGNVQTRMRKLGEGIADATMLALAGLNRLDMQAVTTNVFDPAEILPAVAQGAIGVECRGDDANALAMCAAIGCEATVRLVTAERTMLAGLDGSCRTPIAGLCEARDDGSLWLRGLVAMPDGSAVWRAEAGGDDAAELGRKVAADLRAQAGDRPWEAAMPATS